MENKDLIAEKFRELDPYKMMSVVTKILPYITTKENKKQRQQETNNNEESQVAETTTEPMVETAEETEMESPVVEDVLTDEDELVCEVDATEKPAVSNSTKHRKKDKKKNKKRKKRR